MSTDVTQDAIDELHEGYRAEAEGVGCDATVGQCDCYGGYDATCDGGHCVLDGP